MTDISKETEDFLAHYGVLGMKWGVRKDDRRYTDVVDRKTQKADTRWAEYGEKSIRNFKVHNAMAEYCNARIGALNDKPEYKGVDLTLPENASLLDEYYKDIEELQLAGYEHAVETVLGVSPSGFFKAELIVDEAGNGGAYIVPNITVPNIEETRVKHADTEKQPAIFVKFKTEGRKIIGFEQPVVVENYVAHSSSDLENFLAHYGVLGMKWGVRKDDRGRRRLTVSRKPKAPDTDDYNRTREAIKRNSIRDTKSLTTAELNQVNQRLQLERKYSELVKDVTKIGQAQIFIKGITAIGTSITAIYALSQQKWVQELWKKAQDLKAARLAARSMGYEI